MYLSFPTNVSKLSNYCVKQKEHVCVCSSRFTFRINSENVFFIHQISIGNIMGPLPLLAKLYAQFSNKVSKESPTSILGKTNQLLKILKFLDKISKLTYWPRAFMNCSTPWRFIFLFTTSIWYFTTVVKKKNSTSDIRSETETLKWKLCTLTVKTIWLNMDQCVCVFPISPSSCHMRLMLWKIGREACDLWAIKADETADVITDCMRLLPVMLGLFKFACRKSYGVVAIATGDPV